MAAGLAGPSDLGGLEYLRGGPLQETGGSPALQVLGLGGLEDLAGNGPVEPCTRSRKPGASSAEELKEAGLAIGLARTLLEGALGEWAQAKGAGEVVRMEAATQGRHTAAGHGKATRGTQGATSCMEMVLTQRAALVLKEAASGEGCEAFPADEAVRVPERTER